MAQPQGWTPGPAPTAPAGNATIGPAMAGTALGGSYGQIDDDKVTLADIQENPRAAMAKIGANLKREATDPRTWLSLAASYFGPQAFNYAAPVIARGAAAMGRGASAVGGVLQPGDIGIVSPRLGRAADLAQRVGTAVKASRPAAGETAAAEAVPVASAPPPASAAPPAPEPAPLRSPGPAAKPHLTLEEFRAAQELVKQGYDPADVMKAIEQNRLPKAWLNLPRDADVAAEIANRGPSNRSPRDRP